jgi:hypothetical protein
MITKEIKYDDAVVNGFLALFLNLIVLPLLVVVSFMLFKGSIILFFLLLLFLALAVLMIPGYFSQEPNEARVMVFFGKYKGTFTETGFFWVNPFMNKKKLSLRARNLDVEPIKVNDKIGNPILIGLVLVWKLKDTYKAMFEIDAQTMADNRGSGQMTVTVAGRMNAFEDFVRVQSDSHLSAPSIIRHCLRINFEHSFISVFQFPDKHQTDQNRITNLVIYFNRLHIQVTGT